MARLSQLIYDNRASDWRNYFTHGRVILGVIEIGGFIHVICRGSQDLTDFERDAEVLPVEHPILGMVHSGFAENIDDTLLELMPLVSGKPAVLGGHSLGAAHASLLAALLVSYGRPPAQLTLFGCPRVGFGKLSRILRDVPIFSFRNRLDPVTEVPPPFPVPYVRVVVPTSIDVEPGSGVEPIADHCIDNYLRGMATINGATAI